MNTIPFCSSFNINNGWKCEGVCCNVSCCCLGLFVLVFLPLFLVLYLLVLRCASKGDFTASFTAKFGVEILATVELGEASWSSIVVHRFYCPVCFFLFFQPCFAVGLESALISNFAFTMISLILSKYTVVLSVGPASLGADTCGPISAMVLGYLSVQSAVSLASGCIDPFPTVVRDQSLSTFLDTYSNI
jgi:hypothetical protein